MKSCREEAYHQSRLGMPIAVTLLAADYFFFVPTPGTRLPKGFIYLARIDGEVVVLGFLLLGTELLGTRMEEHSHGYSQDFCAGSSHL